MSNNYEQRLEAVEEEVRHIKSAFIKNEYGDPDYSGHRAYHREANNDEMASKKRSSDIKTNILTWLIGAVITVLLANVFQLNPEILARIGK